MKIGILTFHRALNYGAVLQCYALYETLKSMGHDVEVIDYRPPYIEKGRRLFYWKNYNNLPFFKLIKRIANTPIAYWNRRKASKVFDSFIFKYLKFSRLVKTPEDIPDYYDIIVFGSDQIWSPRICEGFDPIYWGNIKKRNTRFVCYAPSLEEYPYFSIKQWAIVKDYLKNFNSLSVREVNFQTELMEKLDIKAEWVLDPILLVPFTKLRKIAKEPQIQNYVLLFTVQPSDIAYEVASRISQEKGCKIVRACAIPSISKKKEEKDVLNIGACSPEEFLGLIYYSKYVVTNSFHATAISIEMQKDFLCVKCSKPHRLLNILNAVDLNNRYISDVNDIQQLSSIDYDNVVLKLKMHSYNSNMYLMNNIS